MVLRIYGGVFDNYISIRESDIARALKCSVKEVMTRLNSLQKLGIVDYEPQTDQPKITFLKPRFHEQEVRLPKEIYEDRKRTDFERLHSMKRYLQVDRCRSIQLLEYFGEKNVEACGKCDVCQGHKQAGLAAQTFERMSEDLHEIVLKQSVTIDELPSILSHYNREELIQLVRWKLDHNELALDDRMRIVLPGLE
jgi:ATP-dependent DNA helicase RecQ